MKVMEWVSKKTYNSIVVDWACVKPVLTTKNYRPKTKKFQPKTKNCSPKLKIFRPKMKVIEWVSKKLTIQFFVQISSRCNWQSPNKLVKLNSAILEQKNIFD